MTAPTTNLADRIAANKADKSTQSAAKDSAQISAATQADARNAPATATRVFYGELPPAVSYLTAAGTPVYFYNGYHVTENSEVVEFCNALPNIKDITDQVNIQDVPRPEQRTRQRNWAGTAERTSITPGELLNRVVRVQSTAQLPQAAASNSGVVV